MARGWVSWQMTTTEAAFVAALAEGKTVDDAIRISHIGPVKAKKWVERPGFYELLDKVRAA